MRMRLAAVGLLSIVGLPVCALAQTTTYTAPTGSVSPSLIVTMSLSGGGSVTLNPVVGPNCYLGTTCGFPAGYVGTDMSYTLPDGSSANLANFNGTFYPLGSNNYEISGQASGTDSLGRTISVDNVQATMHITCRSGRGGGCTKTYAGGSLTLTVNAVLPTPTETPTPVPAADTATPTATQLPKAGPLSIRRAKLRAGALPSANGRAWVSGHLAGPGDGSFDPSGGLTVRIQTGGLDQTLSWSSDQCATNRGVVRCVNAGRKARVRLQLMIGSANTWQFTLLLGDLAAPGPFSRSLVVTLMSEDFASSGSTAHCFSHGATLMCR